MPISDFLKKQDPSRKKVLTDLHELILQTDPGVVADVGTMMGKEMILYKEAGVFKYGLASGKDYMTLHNMCIYGSSPLHERYRKRLKDAKFQKGCINFKTEMDFPLNIANELIRECAAISMKSLYEQFRKGAAKSKAKK
ncbi:MAG: DUF1801 domain-containing protein [Chitinophagales bacterium]